LKKRPDVSASESHKLWGGRFASPPSEALDALNRSLAIDYRLWPFDIRLSRAWALALREAGVLSPGECDAIRTGLDRVGAILESGAAAGADDEDVHTLVDRLLHETIGDVASKLHTGRSRNDQVATDTRLWCAKACKETEAAVRRLQSVLVTHAERLSATAMPAYTHLQRAQPVLAAHWILAHFWALERDIVRLSAARDSALVLPLGSGAIAGSAFPVPRELLRAELGFAKISPNSIDAVGDRDFVAEAIFGVTMVATHLSRLAEDLIIFGSSEFGFVRFGDAFSTGSSMMPQKRNPDALELARGSAGRAGGDLFTLLVTLKGLPSGYNKDLQEDKRALFGAVDMILLVLAAVEGAVAEVRFDADRMRAALTAGLMATDLADYLVTKGVSFRDAHAAVGALVRESEEKGCELSSLPASAFKSAHPKFGEDAKGWLSAERSIARREIPGGTGPDAVQDQLSKAREILTRAAAKS
jgi:argininosuccinate lyase